jgi:hypothetical protein
VGDDSRSIQADTEVNSSLLADGGENAVRAVALPPLDPTAGASRPSGYFQRLSGTRC